MATTKISSAPPFRTEDVHTSPSPLTRMLISGEMSSEDPSTFGWRERWDCFTFVIIPHYFSIALIIVVHALALSLGLLYYNTSLISTPADSTLLVARIAALVLHCDVALLLFPVCRIILAILKDSPLRAFLPGSKEAFYHEVIAWSMVFFAWVHSIAYWIYYAVVARRESQGFKEFLYLSFATGPGWSGHIMLGVLTFITATSIDRVDDRKRGRFSISHHLYIMFFVIWSVHGAFAIKGISPATWTNVTTFWQYWIVGGVVYVIERILREFHGRHKTRISKVIQHRSNVVEFQIKKGKMTVKVGQACLQ